jgi:hypothetical protein
MAGLSVGRAAILVIEHRNGSVCVDAYASRLEMMMDELDRGSIGNGAYGNEAHLAALRAVAARVNSLIASFEAHLEDPVD